MKRNRWPALFTALALALVGTLCSVFGFRLPGAEGALPGDAEIRELTGLILLVPIGTLITVFVRTVIGFQTFGTFAPGLLAISFAHADAKTSFVLFLLVTLAAVAGRAVFGRLRILAASRLSLLLVVVVILLGVAVPVLRCAGLKPAIHAVLLLMTMLTMIIEHFHVMAEREGPMYAVQVLAGTFFVTALCAVVFRIQVVEEMLLETPWLLLHVAACLVLLGSYSGYRLVELRRFRSLADDRQEDGN